VIRSQLEIVFAVCRSKALTTVYYRGVVRGGVVVLRETDSPLSEGTEVLVTPVSENSGSPSAVVAAAMAAPAVPTERVDELERLIDEGKRPV
jgi:hypothetical protein